jgi:WD40 repeat protein
MTNLPALPLMTAARIHGGPVTALAWSPGGLELASASGSFASNDSTPIVTSGDGTKIMKLVGHTQPVTSLGWSPDGRQLASGSLDGTIRLWSATGKLVRVLDPGAPSANLPWKSSQPVFSLAWSPNGRMLAAGGVDFGSAANANSPGVFPGVIQIWLAGGRHVRTLRTESTAGKFLNVAWSPDGSLIAAGALDYWIWRSDGTRVAHLWPGGTPVWGMAWSPDGKTLAFGDEQGTLALYDADGTPVAKAEHPGQINHLAFSPDGTVLAISDDNLELRAVSDLSQHGVTLGRGGAGPAWSPSGTVAAGAQPSLWDPRGVSLAVLSGCPADIGILAWSPDGARLAGGSEGGEVCVWKGGG